VGFAFRDAIDGVLNQGVLVFKAAGNCNTDAFLDRTNRASRSVVVGATRNDDSRPVWSNHGSTVSLMAPGENRIVAHPAPDFADAILDGTSFAAPMAAGVAATALQPTRRWATPRSRL
jgi:subtilisin family serine protease